MLLSDDGYSRRVNLFGFQLFTVSQYGFNLLARWH